MGMDVYGKNPDAKEGEYFRNNVWQWRPLWEYCCHVAPTLTRKVIYEGQSNDGGGLDAEDSKKLAVYLEQRIGNREAAAYVARRNETLAALPDVLCWLCGGTGRRATPPEIGPGDHPCNRCGSTGHIRPWETEYSLDVRNIENFARFLAHCGGFEIW